MACYTVKVTLSVENAHDTATSEIICRHNYIYRDFLPHSHN